MDGYDTKWTNAEWKQSDEERKILQGIRDGEGVRGNKAKLIENYSKAEDPENQWIRTKETLCVNVAMLITTKMMEKYGEEAKETQAEAMQELGGMLGKHFRERVLARGGDLDDLNELIDEYAAEFPVHFPFYGVEQSKERLVMRIASCHMGNAFKDLMPNLPESIRSSKYWCDFDYGLIKAYNPKVKLSRPKWIVNGAPYCEYVWEL